MPLILATRLISQVDSPDVAVVATRGRPRLDRQLLFAYLDALPRHGRRMVAANERLAAATLNWSRSTVARGFGDLEREGKLRRWKPAGRNGVLVVMGQDQQHQPRSLPSKLLSRPTGPQTTDPCKLSAGNIVT